MEKKSRKWEDVVDERRVRGRMRIKDVELGC